MKKYFWVCLLVVFGCSPSKKDKDIYFLSLNTEYNLLDIKKTDYVYDNTSIYSLSIPDYNHYTLYGLPNFFYLKDGIINIISINRDCYEDYKNSNYAIQNINKLSDEGISIECTIVNYPLLNLKAEVGDTFFSYLKKSPIYWSVLEEKYYSKDVKDTLCKFSYYLKSASNLKYIYYVGIQKGIVGMEKFEDGIATDSVGYPFVLGKSDIILLAPDISILNNVMNVTK